MKLVLFILLLLLTMLAVHAQTATPSERALQAALMDQVRALVQAHEAEANLQAQVADLQKQLADAKAQHVAQETPKP